MTNSGIKYQTRYSLHVDIFRDFIVPLLPSSFAKQLIIILSSIILVGVLGWSSYSAYQLNEVLTQQISLRAKVQSQQLSKLPDLITSIESGERHKVKQLISRLQEASDADFITVSDRQGIRLTHPVESRIGSPVVGGDIDRALEFGESYLSYSVGSLGPSIRYISPIITEEGTVIGMIKVGYLLDTIDALTSKRLMLLVVIGFVVICAGLGISWLFSTYVRSQMQELEPWQIKQALKTHQGVLQATYEGIVAIDAEQHIYLINNSARAMLNFFDEIGASTPEWMVNMPCFSLEGEDYINHFARLNDKNFVINRVTLRTPSGKAYGAVFSLRDQNEMRALSEKIGQVNEYMENMRVTRHEYQNKLSTISGLLQMGAYQKALAECLLQAKASQSQMDSLKTLHMRPSLSALILAKASKATELGIPLTVDCKSDLLGLSTRLSEEQLCSLIGNLTENALEAVKRQKDAIVRVNVNESDNEYIIQVSNNGPAITCGLEALCELGYTTKMNDFEHGIGMHLVRSIVEQGQGHMELDSDDSETAFTIYFSKAC